MGYDNRKSTTVIMLMTAVWDNIGFSLTDIHNTECCIRHNNSSLECVNVRVHSLRL